MNIKVVMTAYNRIGLLTQCINSITTSDYYPEGISVFDDCSEEPEVVNEISRLKGVDYNKNPLRIGCDGNTPHALEVTFVKNPDCTHIVVIDSDLAVTKEWWAHIERCVKSMEGDPQIGAIQALNLDNIPSKKKSDKYIDMLECIYLSGCGLIVSRKFWETFILKQADHQWFAWDVRSTEMAHRAGLKNYCLRETAMQHLGAWDGAHRGPGQSASTFVGKLNMHATPFSGTNVCFIAGENFCDIALSIMAAKIAKKYKYATTIINQNREWGEFISLVSNNEIALNDRRYVPDSRDGRYNIISSDIQKQLGGVSVVVNMETAADKCRWMMYSCGGNVELFIKARLASAGIECSDSDFDWKSLQTSERINSLTYNGYSNGNHTVVNDLEEDKELIREYIDKLEGIVKYLVKERPADGTWKSCIYRLSPAMTVKAINTGGRFVSVMNKSSFVSLFCQCEKFIYEKDEFNNITLPDTERFFPDEKKPKVVLWAPFKLTEEMERNFKGYKFVDNLDGTEDDETNKLIPVDKNWTGFYPGWIQDVLAGNNRLGVRK